jgi:hypothetical protein
VHQFCAVTSALRCGWIPWWNAVAPGVGVLHATVCVGTPIAHGGYLERNGALDQSIGLVGELGNIIERLAFLWLWM